MSPAASSAFRSVPVTPLGKGAAAAALVFIALFLNKLFFHLPIPFPLILAFGVLSALFTLVIIIWKRERSWLIWLSLLIGGLASFYAAWELIALF